MANKRSHSRSGPDPQRAATSGADSLEDASKAAFAQSGHLTGRPAPAVPGQPPGVAPPQQQAPVATVDVGMYENALRERDEFKADLQRLVAEFDNFRKRAIREREQAASAADAKLLGELLVVLDDFERALQQSEVDPSSPLAQGISMVHSRLNSVLQLHGLVEVDTSGSFDPNLHDAIGMQPAEGVAEGTILHVAQKGYMLGERVLRHSKVMVAGE